MNKKAAIEFSANTILVIVISTVILGLGLMLFFNLKSQAEKYTDSIEQQTAEQLKALMLNQNSKIAVYPNDLTISTGKNAMTTMGVNNILDNTQIFQSAAVTNWKVTYFEKPESNGVAITHRINPTSNLEGNFKEIFITGYNTDYANFGSIKPGEQTFRNILIKIPKNWKKGQYLVTINIYNSTSTNFLPSSPPYGVTNLYLYVN